MAHNGRRVLKRIIEIKRVIEWFFQRITGVVLLIGLIVHFQTMHYSGAGQISYEAVFARLSNPYWIVFNIVFLLSVTYHGFNGLLGIMPEYVHSHKMQKVLEGVLIVIAITLVSVGIYILTV